MFSLIAFKALVFKYVFSLMRMKALNKSSTVVDAFVSQKYKHIHVRLISVPIQEQKQGHGTKALNQIQALALLVQLPVILFPEKIENVSSDDVIKFYVKNGFTKYGNDGYYSWHPTTW
jgi:hypothetical protein